MKRSILLKNYKKSLNRQAIIRKAFDNIWYNAQNTTLLSALSIITPVYPLFKSELRYLKLLNKVNKETCDDRSGEETYGYESEESVLHDLGYISDRWMCEFRLQWLIDLIDKHNDGTLVPNFIPKTNSSDD
jgi:hypothetical protein